MPITVARGTVGSGGSLNSLSSAISGGNVPSGMVIRDVPDFIPFVRRTDTPMLGLVGKGGARDMLKWEYGEGDLSPREDVSAGTLATTATSLTVTNGAYFQKYDVIRMGSENLRVTAISTNTLTVVRAQGATTDPGTTYATGTTIYILGPAVPEGVDAPDSPVTRGQLYYTYPQIFEYTWQMTHRARVTPNYEIKSDQFKEEMKRKMKEAAEDLNDTLLNGSPQEGTSAIPSMMGGLRSATTSNVTSLSSAPLTLYDILEAIQSVATVVGNEDLGKTIMANHFTKRVFNSFFQPSRRMTKSDAKMKLTWDEVETDFGVLKFVTNYKMASNELFIWNPSDAKLHPYEGGTWSTGLYSTQGWYDRGFLRGDYGAIFQGDRRRLRMHTYSTTAADYPNLDVPA